MSDNNELDALASEAAQADILAAPPVAEVAAAVPGMPQVDRMAEAALLLGIVKPLAELAVSYIKGAPQSDWQALQAPVAELLAYYDVDVGKWLSSPWSKLAFAATPIVMRGVSNWKAEQEKAKPVNPDARGEAPAPLVAVPAAGGAEPVFVPRG